MADQPSRSWNPALLTLALASEVTAVASSSSRASESEVPSATFPFQLPGGEPLTDGNAAARFIGLHAGNAALLPPEAVWEVESWLEWEERQLRSAACRGEGPQLHAALRKLESAVSNRAYLVGEAVSLADLAVYTTLLPLLRSLQVEGVVEKYLSGLEAQPAFQAALQRSLAGYQPSDILDRLHKNQARQKATSPTLPKPGQRNVLITSALPYVNNVPHLGNIIGCVLSADCYARYCRSRGYNTVYICGTDEYGTATETKAMEEGLTCQQICDKYNAIHAEIYRWFDIQFDKFGRTPTRQQTEITQSIFKTLQKAGHLQERETEQLYSEALGKFLADRFVSGTCPKCGFEDARGDQCDNCGNLLNPTELLNPKCKFTGTTPVLRLTRHLYIDLPKLTPQLQKYIDATSQLGGWSTNCVQVTNGWMRGGLQQRAITRDLRWGTPVPEPGYEKKVFYVWFDAPIGYISITANYTPDWKQWWQNPEDVELVQFMGKDNVPFHTVIFPATLLGTGQPWTMMRSISVTEYLNYEGTQFSKSRGTGVFGNDIIDTNIPVDVWRYYLLANRPETDDTDFKWSDLQARNNGELLANLGNFVNRVLQFTASKSKFSGVVPESSDPSASDGLHKLGQKVDGLLQTYLAAMEKIRLREGIRIAFEVTRAGNGFITEKELWTLTEDTGEVHSETGKPVKRPSPECGAYIAGLLGVVALAAAMVEPYIPSATARIANQLGVRPTALQLSEDLISKASRPQSIIAAGHRIGQPAVLFRIIDDQEVLSLRNRFAGTQADQRSRAAGSKKQSQVKPSANGSTDSTA